MGTCICLCEVYNLLNLHTLSSLPAFLQGKAKKLLGKSEEQPVEVRVPAPGPEEDDGDRSEGPMTTSYRVGGIDDTQWPQQDLGKQTAARTKACH